MKKIISVLLSVVLLLGTLSLIGCSREEYSSEGFTCEYDEKTDGYRAVGYDLNNEYIEVPSSYNDGVHGEKPITILGYVWIPDGYTPVGGGNAVPHGGAHIFLFVSDKIKKIKIPATVLQIDNNLFHCLNLEEIIILAGSRLTKFGAEMSAPALRAITVEDGALNFKSEDGVLINTTSNTLVYYPEGKTEKSYVAPNYISAVGDDCFYMCNYLTEVTLPKQTTLGNYSFNSKTTVLYAD